MSWGIRHETVSALKQIILDKYFLVSRVHSIRGTTSSFDEDLEFFYLKQNVITFPISPHSPKRN